MVTVVLVLGLVGGMVLLAPGAHAGSAAKGAITPMVAPTPKAAPTTDAQVLSTIIQMWVIVPLPASGITPTPTMFSVATNITGGPIANADTSVFATVYDTVTGTYLATPLLTLNTTVVAANVATSINNGIPYYNYTWNFTLSKTTLGCSTASCSNIIPATNDLFDINVSVVEAAGATWSAASNSMSLQTTLVSTYANVVSMTPAPGSNVAVPAAVSFETNTTWGWTTNASTDVYLIIAPTTAVAGYSVISFNNTVNIVNLSGAASTLVFNGTLNGVPYSDYVWTAMLNATTLGYTAATVNTTYGIGYPTTIWLYIGENGVAAGGFNTGDLSTANAGAGVPVTLGTTFVAVSDVNYPINYQPLPFVETGTVNVSYAEVTNATYSAYFQVFTNGTPYGTLLATISGNHTVNYTLGAVGFYLAWNGTINGAPYWLYDWSLTLNTTTMGGAVPYSLVMVTVNTVFSGDYMGVGGVQQVGTLQPVITYIPGPAPGTPPTTTAIVFVAYPSAATPTITSTISAYMPLPFQVNYSIAVVNANISMYTTTIIVNVTSAAVGQLTSTAVIPGLGQTAYTFEVNGASLACDAACVDLPQTEYTVSVFVGVTGIGAPSDGSVASGATAHGFFLIVTPLSASLVSPAPGASVSVGNVSVSVAYSGSYVAGAIANIYSAGGSLVFSHGYIELTPGVPVTATWFIGQTGTYSYSIVMTTVYLPTTHYFNGTITVITKGGTVYQNVTKYSNQSAISGLSGAAAGTILLVVGLIVGMIVALVLARAVMGRPATAPPQPWESKPGTAGAAAPNTCSVCNKSFSTPEELAAHGKSEHGMQ